MDLTPYKARGFSAEFDRAMADVPVRGIDREQAQNMVRLCDDTEKILYGEFSPRRISYRLTARPKLEVIAAQFNGTAAKRVEQAMRWSGANVIHPHFTGDLPADRAMTEEQLIDSGRGWCNEQSRVFIALCEVMGIPARLAFLFHKNGHTAHTGTEVLLDGKWAFHDVTYQVRVELPDGTFAEARELRGKCRDRAHQTYLQPMTDYYRRGKNPPSPRSPSAETGGDFLVGVGICNYLIEGVKEMHE